MGNGDVSDRGASQEYAQLVLACCLTKITLSYDYKVSSYSSLQLLLSILKEPKLSFSDFSLS